MFASSEDPSPKLHRSFFAFDYLIIFYHKLPSLLPAPQGRAYFFCSLVLLALKATVACLLSATTSCSVVEAVDFEFSASPATKVKTIEAARKEKLCRGLLNR